MIDSGGRFGVCLLFTAVAIWFAHWYVGFVCLFVWFIMLVFLSCWVCWNVVVTLCVVVFAV